MHTTIDNAKEIRLARDIFTYRHVEKEVWIKIQLFAENGRKGRKVSLKKVKYPLTKIPLHIRHI